MAKTLVRRRIRGRRIKSRRKRRRGTWKNRKVDQRFFRRRQRGATNKQANKQANKQPQEQLPEDGLNAYTRRKLAIGAAKFGLTPIQHRDLARWTLAGLSLNDAWENIGVTRPPI